MISRPDYSALFAASPYPYLLIDRAFMIIGANPAYLNSTGRTAEDIVGQHIFDAFPANPHDPDSTNLDEVRISIELAIETRKPHTSALLRYAVPLTGPDGVFFEERFWSAIHTPVFDRDGEVAFVSQNAIDVTELYRFDPATRKYYLKRDADAVPDVAQAIRPQQMNRPQMHEAMIRILNAERGQLQTLFDQAPGSIAILNGGNHVFEMVNEAYYELVGHRDVVGKTVLEALPELADQGFMALLDGVFSSGQPVVLHDTRIALRRTPGGVLEDRYVDLLYQPIVGADGRVTGIFTQGNDVTDAYRAKQALSEKIQQLEELRERQAFQLDLADRIRRLGNPDDVTEVACALLGNKLQVSRVLYAEVDDAQRTVFIRHDWTAAGTDSLAGRVRNTDELVPEVVAALRAGETVVNRDVLHDSRSAAYADAYARIGVRADLLVPYVKAGRLGVVLTLQSATPRNWQEHEIRLVQDTAERTWSAVEAAQAQAALRIERDQSQTIFDSMEEGFAVLDRHWTILRMNAEGLRLTQRRAEEVIGHDHWSVWPEVAGTQAEAAYRRVMATGKTEIVELGHTLPDKQQVWIETRAQRTLDGGIAFFFRDVTERRLAQERLTIADQRKDEFLAMLAHELRNPLAPIGAAADLLQVARLDEDRVRQTSQIIGRQVRHMTSLVDDLLDVSRVTRGLVHLQLERLDIGQVAHDAVEQVMPLIRSRHQDLVLALSGDVAAVMGDRKRLVQVLANLLNNAAKYTPEGGRITLATALRAEQVLLHVTDNGIGMAPELAGRAFDLFSQAERSSDRSLGGLGLGLALVKSLVGLHGGSVGCDSPGLGKGSTFTVCLPAAAALPGGHAHAVAVAPAEWRAGRPLHIMIVDDNQDAASMLAMLLESSGHEVLVEHDARRALARCEQVSPEVFLLDIGLPDMDGNALGARLRARPATRDAVIVAVTGYGQERDRAQTAAAGFDHHLVKPVDIRQLEAILADAGIARN
ncbi:hybrid sensor histidine kinase/response regulator [Massilia sp. CFBP9026]|uniref:hybrid sensor histidine kinase/response regulator n=1 Tax=Massilia sp. CFBP9026 TaxID=3096536 RepID=UPI002A69C5B3|nr:PAS domain-containing protein [Massilia sp. CFBP9026]MDY0963013.1 PAS domain-containing protein [Massilia sp. CFBP9026]